MFRRFPPLSLALAATLLDAAWAWTALGSAPRHAASHVSMLSLVLWTGLHLPAAMLASLCLKLAGALDGGAGLPAWGRGLMGALGLAQTFALAWGLGLWWRRRR